MRILGTLRDWISSIAYRARVGRQVALSSHESVVAGRLPRISADTRSKGQVIGPGRLAPSQLLSD